ncbi:MAG: diaminopimelate decarboxylase, partial [Gammaproteobacteria bacterium]|nr:diaminopimelate decarboxylase [Gammaproteobacteria bacterium]
MDYFCYRNQQLFAEDVAIADIAARYGTPCYVYSRATIERHWHAFSDSLKNYSHTICYAVKANSNLAVLNIMARLGSGFDIVSQGELARVLAAGGDAKKVVFSGVGKTIEEITYALEHDIACFNVESSAELIRINQVAQSLQKIAPISIRINPNIDANTHPYISTGLKENKFGIATEQALAIYQQAAQLAHLAVIGIDCHIGSQLTALAPLLEALDKILLLIDALAKQGIVLQHINLGGGLGVRYEQETPPHPVEYIDKVMQRLGDKPLHLILEPGRAIMANAGILVTRVEYLKPTAHKNFAIVDAAMNDLLRPALYQAWQQIICVNKQWHHPQKLYDIVGPICETGDFLGKDRKLAIAE